MKINDLFPSNFLKASDLAGRDPVTLTIKGIRLEKVGDNERPVLYFIGCEKGLCLNKTNASTITAALQTDDTDNWQGAQVQLYATETDYQGQRVPCLRVGSVVASQAPQPPAGSDPLNHAQPF